MWSSQNGTTPGSEYYVTIAVAKAATHRLCLARETQGISGSGDATNKTPNGRV